jgi:hypothetical protein
MLWDRQVKGLRLRVGKHKYTWQFYSDTGDHGDRGHVFVTLGRYDRGGFATVITGGKNENPFNDRDPVAIYSGPHPLLKRAPRHMGVKAAHHVLRFAPLGQPLPVSVSQLHVPSGTAFRSLILPG